MTEHNYNECRRLAYDIANMVCEDCARPLGCESDGCPVRKLVDIFENDRYENGVAKW